MEAVKKAGVIMAIGHVMRYTPYSRKIKQIGAYTPQHLRPTDRLVRSLAHVRDLA